MKLSNLALAAWAYGSLSLVMAILIAACTYIVYHGGPLITVDFLWLYPAGMPLGVEGGIFPAIIGSILLGLLTASMAALNMGLSPSYIWVHMVIPSAMRDGLSAIALGAAYAMGATAPIMYTGAVLYTRSIPNITDPFMALPYHLYILVNEGYSVDLAYATAFVLMVILLCINIICRWIGGRS